MDEKNLLEVLEEIGAENVRVAEKNVQCSCVLADWRRGHDSYSDHAGSMGISIAPDGESKVHCFSCGFGGSLLYTVSLLGRYREVDYTDLLKRIDEIEDLDPLQIVNTIEEYDGETDSEEMDVLGECILSMLFERGAHKSILERGIELGTLKKWGCWYDRRYKRVVFPVRKSGMYLDGSARGCVTNLVGAVGRTVVNHKVKYFNYFDFVKSNYLFGEHQRMVGPKVVVVEGILDTIGVWQAVKKAQLSQDIAVLGLMGANASKIQMKKLVKWFDEVVLFLDNDPAGWTGQRNLARNLHRKVLLKVVKYPGIIKSDPLDLANRGIDIVELIRLSSLLVI